MKVVAIIQARMGSERFPGKVMHKVAGKPMLEYLLDRLDHCSRLDAIVVATSTDDNDTAIADFCLERRVDFCRGPQLDVAGRFMEVLDKYQFDGFVRVNADSPLLDQQLIVRGIEIFSNGNFDLVTNVFPRTFPKGQSVEVLLVDTFKEVHPLMRENDELEHVTRYFYKKKSDFRILNFESEKNYSGIQLSVDTPQDMDIFASIISRMNRPHWSYTLNEILHFYWDLVVPLNQDKVSK